MGNQDDSVMDDTPGVVLRDTHSHPDSAVNARLQSFPDDGDERRLLETWLASIPAQKWASCVAAAIVLVQTFDGMNASITGDNMKSIKGWVCPRDPRETFSSLGMEPKVLKTLFGDPNEYNMKMCSDDALLHLLRRENSIDLLIGTWLLSKITDDDSGALSFSRYQSLREVTIRLGDSFMWEYYGPGILWLEQGLGWYMQTYNGDVHYGKTIVVLQSSGTGKSRAVAELTKAVFQNPQIQKHWGVTVCFRGLGVESSDLGDGYPFADVPVCEFLSNPSIPPNLGLGQLKGEEIAAAFMGALFSVLHDTIMDAVCGKGPGDTAKTRFDHSWERDSLQRARNFGAVKIKANALLVSQSQEILEARGLITPKTSPRIPQGTGSAQTALHIVLDQMEVDSISGPTNTAISQKSSTDETKKPGGVATWVEKLYSILIAQPAKYLDQDRCTLGLSCIIFGFDECSQLNNTLKLGQNSDLLWHTGTPLNNITLLAMQRIIKACDHFEFWFFMLDTTSELHDVYPAADKDTALSWRLQRDYTPLPPWPYLPFDVKVPPPNDLPKTPLEALHLDCLKVYGRPLWSFYHEHELMVAAARKLLCDQPEQSLNLDLPISSEKTKLQVLALHSTRFILNLLAEGTANTMAIASVKSHLRILTHYDVATRLVTSEVPSEPILAIAAGKLLLDDKVKYRRAMRILVLELLLSNNIISLGEKGETLAHIILIVNRDATVHSIGGQICIVDDQDVTEQEYDQGRPLVNDNLHYAVRPFKLDSYLRKLVDKAKITQVGGAFDFGLGWAAQVHMNFTHFIQLDDSVHSYLSYEFAIMCWHRGFALQCVHGQPIIDMLLIGYRGNLSKPFNPEMFVFVALQIKNRVGAAQLGLIDTITCPFLKSGSKRWKPQYMAILMDMGTLTHFQDIQNKSEHQVRVTKGKAVEGKNWLAFDADEEYEAVRINIRGLVPYLSLLEWAPEVFQLQRSNTGLTDLSTWSDALASTMRVTQGMLTLSLKDVQEVYEKRQKGDMNT